MKKQINNLTESLIKDIKNHRIKDMHLMNHGMEMDNAFVENMLESAKKLDP